MGPARDGLTQERLISLYLSGRQFANDLVSCVALIGGSTEATMMIVVIAALVVSSNIIGSNITVTRIVRMAMRVSRLD